MSDKVEITFTCPKCGGGVISIEDAARDDSVVSCKGCGVRFDQGWGEIKRVSRERAKGAVVETFREAFKRGFR